MTTHTVDLLKANRTLARLEFRALNPSKVGVVKLDITADCGRPIPVTIVRVEAIAACEPAIRVQFSPPI